MIRRSLSTCKYVRNEVAIVEWAYRLRRSVGLAACGDVAVLPISTVGEIGARLPPGAGAQALKGDLSVAAM